MGYYNDAAVLASWESKWLDPDYDMASGRYYDDEDEEEEETDLTLDEYFELNKKRNGEKRYVKEI